MSNESPEAVNEGSKVELNIDNENNDENIEKTEESTSVVKEEESSKELQKPTKNADDYNFEPLLYNFDVSPVSHSTSSMTTDIFDDPLRHDHALGIIWLLISKQGKRPGIPQLHWGLQFLQTLQDDDGTYSDDVFLCIHLIEDSLLKQYAKLGNFMQKINESITDDESVMVTSTPKVSDVQGTLDASMGRKLFESTGEDIDEISRSEAVSFTYNEMLSRGSLPCVDQTGHDYTALFGSDISFNTIQKFIKDLQLPDESAASMNKEELIQFANNLRKEHVETIKKEVKKICSLENFMQNLDKKSFKAYMTDDIIKNLAKLGDSDIEDNV